jgi:hypothetical protein
MLQAFFDESAENPREEAFIMAGWVRPLSKKTESDNI